MLKILEKTMWPPCSPDLNPIDFSIWGILQNKACKKTLQIIENLKKKLEKMRENPPK